MKDPRRWGDGSERDVRRLLIRSGELDVPPVGSAERLAAAVWGARDGSGDVGTVLQRVVDFLRDDVEDLVRAPEPTIVWTGLLQGDIEVLTAAAHARSARLLSANATSLPEEVKAALKRGAVIVVASANDEATHALSLGAHEVLRAGAITPDVLTHALESARIRAGVAPSTAKGKSTDEDCLGLTLLAHAFGRGRAHGEGLSETNDALAVWAPLAAPMDEICRLTQLQLSGSSAGAMTERLRELRVSIERAEAFVQILEPLARVEAVGEPLAVSGFLAEVWDLLRGEVEAWASFRVASHGPCLARVPRGLFIRVVAALVARAVEAVRSAAQVDGEIAVRASELEDAILLEVEDNARTPASSSDDHGIASRLAASWLGLVGIRERVRKIGGEMIVDSDECGTAVRVTFPLATGAWSAATMPLEVGTPRGDRRPS